LKRQMNYVMKYKTVLTRVLFISISTACLYCRMGSFLLFLLKNAIQQNGARQEFPDRIHGNRDGTLRGGACDDDGDDDDDVDGAMLQG